MDAVRASRMAQFGGPAGMCIASQSLQVTFTRRIIELWLPVVCNGSYSTGSGHWRHNLNRFPAGAYRANAARLIDRKKTAAHGKNARFQRADKGL
ncbi:hypothetical protein QF000_003848 [Paraburkholderia atlantica]|uniref:hypothetical protein n=1 Tax=Paraburkholderia atlantica TaxID=2654982 RepID=UPI003D24130D